MNRALEKTGLFLWNRWLSIPYSWRRRIVLGAIFWIVFRGLAWYLGFERLVLYLLVGVAVTYIVAELGIRRLIPAYVWFYKQFTGQLLGIIFAALLPIITEAWIRAIHDWSWEEIAVAAATTAVVLYLYWVIRQAAFAPANQSAARSTRRLRRRRRK